MKAFLILVDYITSVLNGNTCFNEISFDDKWCALDIYYDCSSETLLAIKNVTAILSKFYENYRSDIINDSEENTTSITFHFDFSIGDKTNDLGIINIILKNPID